MKSLRTVLVLAAFALIAAPAVAADAPAPTADDVTLEAFLAGLEQPAPEAPEQSLDGAPAKIELTQLCGTCSVSQCSNVPRYNPCYAGSGRGWGSCNIYLGDMCPDGSGWHCICYAQGEIIP